MALLHRLIAVAVLAVATLAGLAPAHADGRRVALIIGNSAYRNVPALPNPANDASDVAAAFRRLGFAVTLVQNGSFDDMRRGLLAFGQQAANADMATVYFAGHGMEVGGENWLIPVDAALKRETDAENEAISLRSVMMQLSNTTSLGLVILDACRNNPFIAKMQRTLASRAISGGLGRIEPVGNVLVAYAARDGTTALDGDGRNSPFTTALLKNIETPGVEVTFMFRNVRDDVMEATRNEQQPFVYGSLSRKAIYLAGQPPAADQPTQQANADAGDASHAGRAGAAVTDRSGAGRQLGNHGAERPRAVALDLEHHARRHLQVPQRGRATRPAARGHHDRHERPLDHARAQGAQELRRRRRLRGARHHRRDHRQARHGLLEA